MLIDHKVCVWQRFDIGALYIAIFGTVWYTSVV